MDNYFEIGKIAGTHGIKGTLRIFPTTDEPDRFSLLKEVIVEYKNEKKVCKVNKVAYHKNFVLLTLDEYNDINDAEKLKGGRILIPAEKALPLGKDEYYTRDLYDLDVYTVEGEYLGKLLGYGLIKPSSLWCHKHNTHIAFLIHNTLISIINRLRLHNHSCSSAIGIIVNVSVLIFCKISYIYGIYADYFLFYCPSRYAVGKRIVYHFRKKCKYMKIK